MDNDLNDGERRQRHMLTGAVAQGVADGVRNALKHTDTKEAIAQAVERGVENALATVLLFLIKIVVGVTVVWVVLATIHHFGFFNILAFISTFLSLVFQKL